MAMGTTGVAMIRRLGRTGWVMAVVGTAVALFEPAAAAIPSGRAGGDQLWLSRFAGGAASYALAVSPDGTRVYVAGCASSGFACDDGYGTVAYDAATGAELWNATYAGFGHGGTAFGIALSPDGSRLFVTGTLGVSSSDFGDYGTVAYDAATGTHLWDETLDQGNADSACCISVGPDGAEVFVTGSAGTPMGDQGYVTLAYDAATGSTLWNSSYQGVAEEYGQAADMGISPDGSLVYVTGTIGGFIDDVGTVAYDTSTGAQVWAAEYSARPISREHTYGLAVSPDGSSVFVVACSGSPVGVPCFQPDYATLAYDATTGAQLWVTTFDDRSHGADFPQDIAVSPDSSSVYVTGYGPGPTATSIYTLAYNAADGTQRWRHLYRAPEGRSAFAYVMAVSPDGARVFVGGFTCCSDFYYDDDLTVAMDAGTGRQLWARFYDGPGHGYDDVNAIGVAPDSSAVYVTGDSADPVGDSYATIAYQS
jgi:hypothetical protein